MQSNSFESFNADISTWDVSLSEQFGMTFKNAKSFNVDLSSWDFSTSTNFAMTFDGATSFNQDVSKWNINPSIIVSTTWMFRDTSSFDQLWCSPSTWALTPISVTDFGTDGTDAIDGTCGHTA